jgi:putative endonuclease
MSDTAPPTWALYMIECTDGSLYTGITTDLRRRLHQHCSGSGAKFFRGRQPQYLVYLEQGHDRSSALKREYAIKQLNRNQKQQLLNRQALERVALG